MSLLSPGHGPPCRGLDVRPDERAGALHLGCGRVVASHARPRTLCSCATFQDSCGASVSAATMRASPRATSAGEATALMTTQPAAGAAVIAHAAWQGVLREGL